MALWKFVVVLVVTALVKDARAVTEEEQKQMRSKLEPIIAYCGKEHDVSMEKLKTARVDKSFEGINSCFMACVMKKINLFNDDGKLDVESAEEKSKAFFSSKDDQDHILGILKKCASVNDAEVSDGEKGCDRAKLLGHCLIDQKYEFL